MILAAGHGSRMNSDLPKPLHKVLNRPMLEHVLQAAVKLNPQKIVVVVKSKDQEVSKYLQQQNICKVEVAHQLEQLGTGHAVKVSLPLLKDIQDVLILPGDVPGVLASDLQRLVKSSSHKLALLTAKVNNPFGLGRVLRDSKGSVVEIVEQVDLSPNLNNINEVNSGILVAPLSFLCMAFDKINNNNKSNEYYLPSIIPIWIKEHGEIKDYCCNNANYLHGVNTQSELIQIEKILASRRLKDLESSGVIFYDIDSVSVRGDVSIEPGAVIDNNVIFSGKIFISANAIINAGCILEDCIIANDAKVLPYSVCKQSTIGEGTTVGPFAVLNNVTVDKNSYIGCFVDVKRSSIGSNVKAKHLAYLGDAKIHSHVNIGAGVITCNYDGANKHLTSIQERSFVGAGVNLVAPITINKSAFVAAGTTLRVDAPSEQLTVALTRPKHIKNWQRPTKEDSK